MEDSSATGSSIFVGEGTATANLFVTRPLFSWRNYTTTVMTMTANGYLGIGNATPGTLLHVGSASEVAQELQKVAPEFVRENDDGFLQVYYDGLIPWITEAIKMLDKRLTEVKINSMARDREMASIKAEVEAKDKEIKELKARLERIEKVLNSK